MEEPKGAAESQGQEKKEEKEEAEPRGNLLERRAENVHGRDETPTRTSHAVPRACLGHAEALPMPYWRRWRRDALQPTETDSGRAAAPTAPPPASLIPG